MQWFRLEQIFQHAVAQWQDQHVENNMEYCPSKKETNAKKAVQQERRERCASI